MTMLGKSSKWTSRGSNIPFLVTMICLGCSSTGNDLINAATSSAVFHLANYNDVIKITWYNHDVIKITGYNSDVIRITWHYILTWPNLFWPAHTEVWMIFKNSWPVRGLNTKIAPLMGLVVRLPSNVYQSINNALASTMATVGLTQYSENNISPSAMQPKLATRFWRSVESLNLNLFTDIVDPDYRFWNADPFNKISMP